MVLQSLSYTSAAVRLPSAADLQHLLAKARVRNQQESVTGVLLYAEGTFHQYLEGPPDGLDRVFAAIERDPLHHHIFEMLREDIEVREFDHWAMAYRGVDPQEPSADEQELTRLLADRSARLSGGRLLLNAFWNNGLGTRYLMALRGRRPTP